MDSILLLRILLSQNTLKGTNILIKNIKYPDRTIEIDTTHKVKKNIMIVVLKLLPHRGWQQHATYFIRTLHEQWPIQTLSPFSK